MTMDERRRTKDEIVKEIKNKFGGRIKSVFEKSKKRVYVEIDPKDVVETARYIFNDLEARLSTASCVDMPDGFEILYHWSFDGAAFVVSVRTRIAKADPKVGSLTVSSFMVLLFT